jgi:uncharacterized protein
MKLHPDRIDAPNLITAYTQDAVVVGDRSWTASLVLPWQGEARAWPVATFEALERGHFDPLAELAPDILLFGSGARLRFPRPEWLASLMAARIGIETMDVAAACRTYNLLVAEGRKVVAALLIEPDVSA